MDVDWRSLGRGAAALARPGWVRGRRGWALCFVACLAALALVVPAPRAGSLAAQMATHTLPDAPETARLGPGRREAPVLVRAADRAETARGDARQGAEGGARAGEGLESHHSAPGGESGAEESSEEPAEESLEDDDQASPRPGGVALGCDPRRRRSPWQVRQGGGRKAATSLLRPPIRTPSGTGLHA